MSSRTRRGTPSESAGSERPRTGAGAGAGSAAGARRGAKPVSKTSTAHISRRVAQRNSALNIAGGTKVDVFIRCRPFVQRELDAGVTGAVKIDSEKQTVVVEPLDPKKPASETFHFDKAFGQESTQEDVYNLATQPVVDQVVRGLSSCVFAYGQTGTGKTHTLFGELSDGKQHGVVPRAVSETIARLTTTYPDTKIRCTYLEVYNENLVDLLYTADGKPPPLKLAEDPTRGTVCHNLTEVEVTDTEQVMTLLMDAQHRCHVGETAMNERSNRAHRIFTLLVSFTRAGGDVHSALTFVDLAGSESVQRSGVSGARSAEAGNINKSLLTLGRVISALASKAPYIPYRDSKLTRLTSEALGGVCKTSFIATITASNADLAETMSTLRYAQRAMEALNISQLPRWKQDEIMIEHYQQCIKEQEKAMQDERAAHRQEVAQAHQRITAVEEEKKALEAVRAKQEGTIQELQDGLLKLKARFDSVVAQKQRLEAKHTSLQGVHKEVTHHRDSLLADVDQLQNNLRVNRIMRNKMLEAHQMTENDMRSNIKQNSAVRDAAISDVKELEQDVDHRRSVSIKNEDKADEFNEQCTATLHAAMDSVGDFRAKQVEQFAALREEVNGTMLAKQKELAAVRADLAALVQQVSEAHEELATEVSSFDLNERNRSRGLRDTQRAHRDQAVERSARTRDAVTACVSELMGQVAGIGDQLQIWADKMSTHIKDTTATTEQHARAVQDGLSDLDEFFDKATAAHASMLQKHRDALQSYMKESKATFQASQARMREDLLAQLDRMQAEQQKASDRRLEAAVSSFTASTDALDTDVKQMHTRAQSRTAVMGHKTAAWLKEADTSATAAAAVVAASLEATKRTAASIGTSAEASRKQVTDGTAALQKLSSDHMAAVKQQLQTAAEARAATIESLKTQLKAATAAVRGEVDRLTDAEARRGATFKAAMDEVVESVHGVEGVTCDFADEHHVSLDSHLAAVSKYVESIERIAAVPAPPRTYALPEDVQRTRPYTDILVDLLPAYAREEAISTGAKVAGPGVDFGVGVDGRTAQGAVDSCASSDYESDEDGADTAAVPSAAAAASLPPLPPKHKPETGGAKTDTAAASGPEEKKDEVEEGGAAAAGAGAAAAASDAVKTPQQAPSEAPVQSA